MGFFLGLARFVKLALMIALVLVFLRVLLFPNPLDIIILMMLLFVQFIMMAARP